MGHDAVDQEHRGLCDGITTSIDPFSNCLVPLVKKDFTEHSVRTKIFRGQDTAYFAWPYKLFALVYKAR